MVKGLSCYKWSSYLYYAYGDKNDIVTKNSLYDTLGNDVVAKQQTYREYVLTPRAYEDIIDKEFRIT